MPKVGIIGGSGLYQIDALKNIKEITVETPFGEPSDSFIIGNLGGVEVAFLARHKRGHTILPTEINYRANIYAMKKLGVEQLVSISAVGSFKKELKPLDIVLPDQFVDRTNQARKTTFFGQGVVVHISFADPVCADLRKIIYDTGKKLGVTIHDKGAYLNMEGPAFSTRAESHLYKSWGMDIIGMTNMPEAKLAREAEICYATVAMVTDFDCWHPDHDNVTVDAIVKVLLANADKARALVKEVAQPVHADACADNCACRSALQYAILTAPEARDAAMALKPLAGALSAQVFAFGLFVASVFSATILPLATAFFVCEAFGFEAGIDKDWDEAPEFYILYTSIIVLGMGIILIPNAPLIKITLWTQIINGLLLPVVLICMMLLINNKKIMGEYTNKRINNIIGWTAVIVMVFLSGFLFLAPFFR